MKIKQIASEGVVGTWEGQTLAEAAALLDEDEIGALIVYQEALPVGVFSERDLVRAIADGADLEVSVVSEYMTTSPVAIDEETPLTLAIAEMDRHMVRHLAVTRDEEIVGMVSARDVIHALSPKAPLFGLGKVVSGLIGTKGA